MSRTDAGSSDCTCRVTNALPVFCAASSPAPRRSCSQLARTLTLFFLSANAARCCEERVPLLYASSCYFHRSRLFCTMSRGNWGSGGSRAACGLEATVKGECFQKYGSTPLRPKAIA
eukprot:6196290-Pleurochrysis_carterae.AAC.4